MGLVVLWFSSSHADKLRLYYNDVGVECVLPRDVLEYSTSIVKQRSADHIWVNVRENKANPQKSLVERVSILEIAGMRKLRAVL